MVADHASEYIDVLDEKGNLTGKKKTYAEIHRDGLRHRVMHAWLLNSDGELLLQRRSPAKENYPDMWDISTAGHIDSGETSRGAVIREANEELGLDLKESGLEYLFTVDSPRTVLNNGTYIDWEFQDVYLIKFPKKEDFILQKSEVAETKWMPWQELEKIIKGGDSKFVPHRKEYEGLFSFLRSTQK